MVERTASRFERLDAAFNNAGIMQRRVDTAEIEGDEWDRVIAVNLRGVWSCMKHELRQMLRSGGGAIVNARRLAGSWAIRAWPPITRRSTGSSA